MHVMCACVCRSSDHLCLRLQLCDARIEIWRDLISHTPKTKCAYECVCVHMCVRAPRGVIYRHHFKCMTLKHHESIRPKTFGVFSFLPSCRLSHFYPCAHIRPGRIRGHVTNLLTTQREGRERYTEIESERERRVYQEH